MTAITRLAERCKVNMGVLEHECMCRHTTFGIGGAVPLMLLPQTTEQAAALPALCREWEVPYLLLGNGSNLLVADGGWQGAVIKTKGGLQRLAIDDVLVTAESGLMLARLASALADAGLDGMAWAHGIPGTVGGALRMNGGAYGGCMADVVVSVEAVDEHGKLFTLTAGECRFGYRHSVFVERDWMVLSVTFRLARGASAAIWASMEDLMRRRKDKQPLEFHSAGSYFKRPAGHYASALVDECGLKGYAVGDAQVSEKHAGFVINRGGAAAADVLELERHVKAVVLKKAGVALECEVVKLGL